jgi:hypothetical protein
VNQDEVESQLSAMFDGELPAAECELLSRRLDRDENLRARWSRYALIGAAMRSEPVATARNGFARRVSAAIEASSNRKRLRRGGHLVLNAALAAGLVAAVAGLGVTMLRQAALDGGMPASNLTARALAPGANAVSVVTGGAARAADAAPVAALKVIDSGPISYVTPAGTSAAPTLLRTELADYIVLHSAFSAPLLRRNVLSELATSEEQLGIASGSAGAVGTAQGTSAGGGDAVRSPSAAAGR